MKKCGIITLRGFNNYGNRLQNYAAVKVLEHINVVVSNFYNVKKLSFLNFSIYNLFKGNFIGVYRTLIFKHLDNNLVDNIYANKNIKKKSALFEYFICGSDQIWNPNIFKDYYFAAFAPPKKRIAYAASFGVSEIPDCKKELYTKYLNEMKAISVREEAGAKIVKELTGRDAEVLVDPTLMLDKADWQKISKKPKYIDNKKYVLTYFLGEISLERKQYIDSVCKQYDCKLINLDAKNPNEFWYKTGPAEFLWLIEHAELMLTDSFHGSVFSVLMDTPFLVFDRDDTIGEMSSRIDTLLNTLKLQDRRFDNQQGSEIFKKDYEHIPEILKTEREKAICFLKTAMELE